jgi:hypothetical protein
LGPCHKRIQLVERRRIVFRKERKHWLKEFYGLGTTVFVWTRMAVLKGGLRRIEEDDLEPTVLWYLLEEVGLHAGYSVGLEPD